MAMLNSQRVMSDILIYLYRKIHQYLVIQKNYIIISGITYLCIYIYIYIPLCMRYHDVYSHRYIELGT